MGIHGRVRERVSGVKQRLWRLLGEVWKTRTGSGKRRDGGREAKGEGLLAVTISLRPSERKFRRCASFPRESASNREAPLGTRRPISRISAGNGEHAEEITDMNGDSIGSRGKVRNTE